MTEKPDPRGDRNRGSLSPAVLWVLALDSLGGRATDRELAGFYDVHVSGARKGLKPVLGRGVSKDARGAYRLSGFEDEALLAFRALAIETLAQEADVAVSDELKSAFGQGRLDRTKHAEVLQTMFQAFS